MIVDGSIQPARTVAIFDLDRTLTRRGTWTPFLISVLRRRRRRWLATPAIVPALLSWALGATGRKQLKEAMMRAVMAGLSRQEVAQFADAFADKEFALGLRPGAVQAVERHKADGHHLMLATASMDFYSENIARRLGIDTVVSTRSTWDGAGRVVCRIDGENCYGEEKLDAVREALPWPRDDCRIVAYSDHVSDLPLLEWADRGVVVNPRPRFAEFARSLGYEIVDWGGATPAGKTDPSRIVAAKADDR